jgi:glucose-6-phosphate 1-dehydrogenase
MSENNALVIFGSTGDLTYNKLLPSIARLNEEHPHLFTTVFLIGRQVNDIHAYLELAQEKGLNIDDIDSLIPKLTYVNMQAGDASAYPNLASSLSSYTGRFFYVAMPPSIYWVIADALVQSSCLTPHNPHHRIAFEKPFGEDATAAHVLVHLMQSLLHEDQLFRVDHYLAKPMIQALVPLRQSLAPLASFFQSPYLQSVTVQAYETLGVLSRGKFYEATGAMNDMIQSHLLFTLTQACAPFSTRDLPLNTTHFLNHLIPQPSMMKLGQYVGYRQEIHVDPESFVETFAALPFLHDDPRYQDVQFWIATGKKCSQKRTDIVFSFQDGAYFRIKIAPDIGITYNDAFMSMCSPSQQDVIKTLANQPWKQAEAYETIFFDFIRGEHRLFPSSDDILASWSLMKPFHQGKRMPILYKHEQEVWKGVLE